MVFNGKTATETNYLVYEIQRGRWLIPRYTISILETTLQIIKGPRCSVPCALPVGVRAPAWACGGIVKRVHPARPGAWVRVGRSARPLRVG